ncbi:MAG: HAMP domain-containing histidine kinase, partial [Planctomycetes bacterium]|nr:HAMP domain-containing histidine kinase [Planctomycetota bacterium]
GDPTLARDESNDNVELKADSSSKAQVSRENDSTTADSVNADEKKASATAGEAASRTDSERSADEVLRSGNLRDVVNLNQRDVTPLKEQQIANEVLAINDHAQEIQKQSLESRGARQTQKKADSPTNSWVDLQKNTVGYDMYGESRVRIYPYRRLALPQTASPMVIFVRTVETPVTTYLQGFVLDADAIVSYWQKQRAVLPNATDIAEEKLIAFVHRGDTLDPRSPGLREQIKKAFPTLPLLVAADVSDIAGRYDATRLDYALMAGAYTMLLLVLGFFLMRTVARREALVQQQRDFVAAVSHELRTPLSSIRLQAEMLGGHPQARGIEAVHRVAERIVRDQERLMRLVDTILVSSRIERRSLALTLTQASPEQSLRRAVEQAQRHYPKREVTLEMDAMPTLSLDPVVAEQLFYNLIDNALKYSKESGATVRVAARAETHRIVVTVADQGCGMEPSEVKHAFEKFYRGKRANEFGAGTGLGLWLCESYAHMLGWSIGIESALGKGCTMTVEIPLSTA